MQNVGTSQGKNSLAAWACSYDWWKCFTENSAYVKMGMGLHKPAEPQRMFALFHNVHSVNSTLEQRKATSPDNPNPPIQQINCASCWKLLLEQNVPQNGDFPMTLPNSGSLRILLFLMIKYIYQTNLINLAPGGKEWLGMPFGKTGAVPRGNWDKSQSF